MGLLLGIYPKRTEIRNSEILALMFTVPFHNNYEGEITEMSIESGK